MYRKLLFNNLSIVWNIKILLITFCQKIHLANLGEKNSWRKWVWPISQDSPQFRESVGIRFFNVRQRVISQNTLALIIVPPSGEN